jgi:hypothetical protein
MRRNPYAMTETAQTQPGNKELWWELRDREDGGEGGGGFLANLIEAHGRFHRFVLLQQFEGRATGAFALLGLVWTFAYRCVRGTNCCVSKRRKNYSTGNSRTFRV